MQQTNDVLFITHRLNSRRHAAEMNETTQKTADEYQSTASKQAAARQQVINHLSDELSFSFYTINRNKNKDALLQITTPNLQ